ncbi:MAG: GNAT family N-acetyltransferase [Gemmataceae bacterium]
MTLLIRPPTAEDVGTIVAFNQRLAWETEAKALDTNTLMHGVQAVLADPHRGRYVLAELHGQVVGQLLLTWEWSDWRNGWFWWIQSVYVRAENRQQGVFRALYDHVLQEARRQSDVVGLRLYVENHNIAAQATYHKLGLLDAGYRVLEHCPLSPATLCEEA